MAHSHDYVRSHRRTIVWRWDKARKRRKDDGPAMTRVDVVNLFSAREKGIPDRVAIKRILANLHGDGPVDFDHVQIISVDE